MAADNICVLEHILGYCDNIDKSIMRFGNEYDIFQKDNDFQNTICMSVLQIGELTTHLSEEFKLLPSSQHIDWRGYKYIRNICAHRYGSIEKPEIWNVINEDIPVLKKFCQDQIKLKQLLEQEAIEPEYDEDEFEM